MICAVFCLFTFGLKTSLWLTIQPMVNKSFLGNLPASDNLAAIAARIAIVTDAYQDLVD